MSGYSTKVAVRRPAELSAWGTQATGVDNIVPFLSEGLKDDVESHIESKSEAWQEGERGEAWLVVASELDDKETSCDDIETAPELTL